MYARYDMHTDIAFFFSTARTFLLDCEEDFSPRFQNFISKDHLDSMSSVPAVECMICMEAPSLPASSLLCSAQKHSLCFSPDCILRYAESAEALARTAATAATTKTVPCCGSGRTIRGRPECLFNFDDFLRGVSASAAHGNYADVVEEHTERAHTERRAARITQSYRQLFDDGEGSTDVSSSGEQVASGDEEFEDACWEDGAGWEEFDSFANGMIEELSLRCPRLSCRRFLDPDPDGCARVTCLHCGAQLCWVCFRWGFDTKVGYFSVVEDFLC